MKQETSSLLSLRFLGLNACYFSLCSTLAAFFGLQSYMESIGIEGVWNGLLMGAVGLGALISRPFIAPRLRSLRACLLCLVLSSVVLEAALACYALSSGAVSLLFVRIFNGFGFAGVFCAIVALSPYAFEGSKSGRAFSIISIVCLLPFIGLPPLLGWASAKLGSFAMTVFASGAPLALSAPLTFFAFKRHGDGALADDLKSAPLRRCLTGFARPWLAASMFATFAFYYAYAWVFYNADSLCKAGGAGNPGLLLSAATVCAIAFRLIVGKALDGRWRAEMLVGSLLLNAAATWALTLKGLPAGSYWLVFVAFGISWGAAVPLLLSVVMDKSKLTTQGFNLNMSSQMQDLGYFMGPLLGGSGSSSFIVPLAGCAASAVLLKKGKKAGA